LYDTVIEFDMPIKLLRLIKKCFNETCSEIHICKILSDAFPIQNGLKQGDVVATAFQLCSRICHQKGPKYREGFQLNGTHQLLVCPDGVNTLCQNVNTIKKTQISVRV